MYAYSSSSSLIATHLMLSNSAIASNNASIFVIDAYDAVVVYIHKPEEATYPFPDDSAIAKHINAVRHTCDVVHD